MKSQQRLPFIILITFLTYRNVTFWSSGWNVTGVYRSSATKAENMDRLIESVIKMGLEGKSYKNLPEQQAIKREARAEMARIRKGR